ncbi:hypothetical protein [Cohnella silvisoli]|uniref:Mannitol-1-phosphate 5-dehydrogenase n=1 Tax=Cohnella silvisoli TaxID=2873699 RepID=A0ABV1KSL8_9BACL|nr:hypothetical protein [Cohnella silvisoli]MCD9021352.1 hypothetical protein [Cohnella silvisoli]
MTRKGGLPTDGIRILNVVVIGAGRTGRGFAARLLSGSAVDLFFIDANELLVRYLREDLKYGVHFFGGERSPVWIELKDAAVAGSDGAADLIAKADLMITAVGEQNLGRVATDIARILHMPRMKPLHVLTCENGVRPGETLEIACREAGIPQDAVRVAEAAVFCSTVDLPGTRLDILSESFDKLPVDSLRLPSSLLLSGMVAEPRMRELLTRKIYTYNCISACIAYLGVWKDYSSYSEAANDPDITVVLDRTLGPLNSALSLKLDIPLPEQMLFAEQALSKFRNPDIRDDIDRNARDVIRKLGPDERLMAPLRLVREAGGETAPLCLVSAAALWYGETREAELRRRLREAGPAACLREIGGMESGDPAIERIVAYYVRLKREHSHPEELKSFL